MKHFYILLGLTFMVGFASGVFIYFHVRQDSSVSTEGTNSAARFEISADTYGGCERGGCSSYHILSDGSYTFIFRKEGQNEARAEDTLTQSQISELLSLANESELSNIEHSPRDMACDMSTGGIGYRFDITIKGREYLIDSCKQDISSSALLSKLVDYFQIFKLVHNE